MPCIQLWIATKESTSEWLPVQISQDPIRWPHSPETAITSDPVWDKCLRKIFPDREGTRECDHRIVPAGCINPKCWEGNLTSRRHPDLSVIRLESGSGTRCEGNGVYGKDHRLSHSISLHWCIILQSERRSQIGQQSSSRSCGCKNWWIPGNPGSKSCRRRTWTFVGMNILGPEGARSHQSGSHHLWWSYRDPICCRENVPGLLMADVSSALHPGSSQKSPSETSQRDYWDSERISEWCR